MGQVWQELENTNKIVLLSVLQLQPLRNGIQNKKKIYFQVVHFFFGKTVFELVNPVRMCPFFSVSTLDASKMLQMTLKEPPPPSVPTRTNDSAGLSPCSRIM
jgi:hypothetical protein